MRVPQDVRKRETQEGTREGEEGREEGRRDTAGLVVGNKAD